MLLLRLVLGYEHTKYYSVAKLDLTGGGGQEGYPDGANEDWRK